MSELTPSILSPSETAIFEETRLPNGIRVLTEHMPSVRSAAVGIWVPQGSAHEEGRARGASHLLEHLVFKGTERRTAKELALELEGVGGSLDAYTAREHTSYQARVLDEHLDVALDVLSDLVLSPLLRAEDLELEREVVLEEIATVEDTPDDLVFEIHAERLWNGHPYGQSILGTRETVGGMSVDTLKAIHESRYRSGGLIVVATGHVEHDRVVAGVDSRLGHLAEGSELPDMESPKPMRQGDFHMSRDTSQTHVVLGTELPRRSDPRRFALVLINTAFGAGMSSRLFQRVREELALAYSVFSYQSFYRRAGTAGVYVGTRPGWDDRAVEAILAEYARMAESGLGAEELEQTKSQVKGRIMLSLESPGARMYRLAEQALHGERYRSLDRLLEEIEEVTREEVSAAAEEFFSPDRQLVLRLGP